MAASVFKKYYPYFLILLFSVPLFFLNVYSTHGWGDDFAQYVKEGENIAHGKPYYQSNYVYNDLNTEYAPPQYPPGYPMLIAPAIKFFGINFTTLYFTNTILFVLLFLVLFAYFSKYTHGLIALCLSIVIIYSNVLIDLKGQVLSDAPCLLFVALYLYLRNTEAFTWQRLTLLTLTATMAMLVRSQGLLLLAAEAAYFGIQFLKRKYTLRNFYKAPSVIVLSATALLLLLLNTTIFSSPNSTGKFYSTLATHYFDGVWATIGNNCNYLISLFLEFFHFHTNDPFFQAPISIIKYGAIVFAILGFIISIKDKLKVDDMFFMIMCLFIIVFPEHQGVRFLVEALPVYVLYIFFALRKILPSLLGLKRGIAIAVVSTLVFLILGYDTYQVATRKELPGGMPVARDSIIFRYINEHVPPTETIMFVKPRALALFCKPKFINHAWQADFEGNRKQFEKLNVRYFLAGFDERDFARNYVRQLNVPYDSVQIIDDIYLYRLLDNSTK